MTFTHSILKLNGALSIMIIIKRNVFMRIIFRISEESLTCSDMTPNFVKIGKVVPLLPAMKKVANDCRHVAIVMDGKNSNFTL